MCFESAISLAFKAGRLSLHKNLVLSAFNFKSKKLKDELIKIIFITIGFQKFYAFFIAIKAEPFTNSINIDLSYAKKLNFNLNIKKRKIEFLIVIEGYYAIDIISSVFTLTLGKKGSIK